MSFYRTIIAAVAAMSLATAVLAADESTTAAPADASQASTAAQTSDTQAPAAQAADQTKVDLNKASVKDLMKVKGMTSAKAKAIVAYRKKHGDFKSTDDLKMVKGFKKMKDDQMKNLQDQLTVG